MDHEIVGSSIPILREGSKDYVKSGNNYPLYKADIKLSATTNPSAEIKHILEGDSIASSLIDEGKAQFACELIFQGSFKRQVFLHEPESEAEKFVQKISWDGEDAFQKVFFRPMIVSNDDYVNFKINKDHQVSELWEDTDIKIPKFAILADDQIKSPSITSTSIFKINYNENFNDTQMEVVGPINETGNSYFIINAGKALYKLLSTKTSETSDLRKAIVISALTEAFSILARDHLLNLGSDDNKIDTCPVLLAMHEALSRNNIPTWSDDDTNFSPLKAATFFESFAWTEEIIEEDD